MTRENVIAIWRDIDTIPHPENEIVYLELGHQNYKPDGTPAVGPSAGAGWLHILARHTPCSAARGISNIFDHLSRRS